MRALVLGPFAMECTNTSAGVDKSGAIQVVANGKRSLRSWNVPTSSVLV